MSSMSFSVSAAADRPPPLRLMPLLLDSTPPCTTLQMISVPLTSSTQNSMRPSSSSRVTPALHVIRQFLVVEADAGLVAQRAGGVENERVALGQRDLVVLELADADFRALQVDQHADGAAARARQRAHQFGAVDMVLRGAVGKIEAHHIQAGFHHPVQGFGIGTGGAEGGDDFGSANH